MTVKELIKHLQSLGKNKLKSKKNKNIDYLAKAYSKLTDKEKYRLHIINCKSGFAGEEIKPQTNERNT